MVIGCSALVIVVWRDPSPQLAGALAPTAAPTSIATAQKHALIMGLSRVRCLLGAGTMSSRVRCDGPCHRPSQAAVTGVTGQCSSGLRPPTPIARCAMTLPPLDGRENTQKTIIAI